MKTFLTLLKSRPLEFYALTVLVVFATICTNGRTIAWGLLPILVYLFYHAKPRTVSAELLLFSKFFAATFVLNFCAVFNFNDLTVDMPHPDYHFYSKISWYFNEFGIENYLNSKMYLLKDTDFATPYRFLDTWILSAISQVSPFSDLVTVQILFRPLTFAAVSYTFYSVFKPYVKNVLMLLLLSVFINFFLADYFTASVLAEEKLALLSVSSYPKLWIYYVVFLRVFLSFYNNGWRSNTQILFLVVLPILVQTTAHLYLIVACWMLLDFKFFRKNLFLTFSIVLSVLFYVAFYALNQEKQAAFYNSPTVRITSSPQEFWTAFCDSFIDVCNNGGLLISAYILIFVLIFKFWKFGLKLYLFSITVLLSGMIMSALLPTTPNNYQFYLNLLPAVFGILLVLILCVQSRSIYSRPVLLILVLLGFLQQQFTIGFYNTQNIWNNDLKTVAKFKQEISDLTFPIGVTYYKNVRDNYNEHFDQRGTDLLLYGNAQLDVVNLRSLELFSLNAVDSISIGNSAISIWRKQQNIQTNIGIEQRFLEAFPFGFLFTDCQLSELPPYLSSRVIPESQIPLYGTSFYKLK